MSKSRLTLKSSGLRNWKGVSLKLRSRESKKMIDYSISVRDEIAVNTADSLVLVNKGQMYKAMISEVGKCDGFEDLGGIFMLLNTKGLNGLYPVIIYENWTELLIRWEITGRRVLVEKKGYYI